MYFWACSMLKSHPTHGLIYAFWTSMFKTPLFMGSYANFKSVVRLFVQNTHLLNLKVKPVELWPIKELGLVVTYR